MQYQLEHHLFPTMPRCADCGFCFQFTVYFGEFRSGRYKYPRIQAQVKAFGEANQLEYRVTDEWELLRMNVELYSKVATLPPVPGAKASRPDGPKTDITRSHPSAAYTQFAATLAQLRM